MKKRKEIHITKADSGFSVTTSLDQRCFGDEDGWHSFSTLQEAINFAMKHLSEKNEPTTVAEVRNLSKRTDNWKEQTSR